MYALGLVLHEMLTGRRVFEAKSLNELRALHAETKPPSLSSSATDVDPSFERVVMRCLSRDPNDRPASARVVLASLPGGDPLQAALLAGETPSPEMVAAAAKVGDLRPGVAWACLVGGLFALWLITTLAGQGALYRRAPLPNSPDVLVARAKEVLARVGRAADPVDTAHGFVTDNAFLDYVTQTDPSPTRWERLRTARPGAFLFSYRESPTTLVSTAWVPAAPWDGPVELGRVAPTDPLLNVPGMTMVVLDAQGRLVSYAAAPPRFHADSSPAPDADWSVPLTEAGLDLKTLHPSETHWTAPTDSDHKAAWDGILPGQPEVRFHIEAASYRGRLTYFELQGPWVQPPADSPRDAATGAVMTVLLAFLCVVVLPVGAVLVRRNLRLGRGDRRGALRIAAFTFVAMTLASLFRADHTALPVVEYSLLVQILSQGFYLALSVWFLYMALEPAVRRRWPETLISWNRLLSGRFGDPLVGRDVMVGALAGMAVVLALRFDWLGAVLGGAPSMSGGIAVSTLSAPRHLAYFFFLSPCLGITYSVVALFMLYLFDILVRRAWLARLLLFLVFLGPALDGSLAGSLRGVIFSAIMVTVLIRFGLLASSMCWFVFNVLLFSPLTLDWTAWYAGRSFAVLGFFATLLVAGFYTSLGGKPLFGKALLDD